jgi:hypothetical protein
MEIEDATEVLLTRFIGLEDEILRFLRELEAHYNIKLYPDRPRIDRKYAGCVRIYCRIPLDRPPIEKEVADNE